ncbi:hypothetical protein [Thiomicrorhabdus aquaedulcis]|uniref:hypothetical protein n=1 Tax=Thiomicrorhabdus aquaedulcis TaxID=2211106 RepID=UPI000FDC5D9E|nr:hypothetical protein [Thiomicrorhabdus aquaedulcis]
MQPMPEKSPEAIQRIVDETLDEMYARKEKLSIRSLIDRVGTDVISSTSTASKYKRSWDDRRLARENELFDRLGFSSEFTQAFMQEISRFSADIESRTRKSSEDLRTDNSELERELERVERLAKDFEILATQKEKEIGTLNQRIESEKQSQKHALESQGKDHKHELETLQTKYQTQISETEKQYRQLTEKVLELQTIIEELRRNLAQADLRLESLKSLEDTNSKLLNQVSELNTQLSDNKANAVGLSRDVDSKQNQIATLEKTAERELLSKDKEIEALKTALAKQEELTINLREEVASRKGENDSLNSQISRLNSYLTKKEV